MSQLKVLVLASSVLLACPATAAVLENGILKVDFDEANGALTVTDLRTARVWKPIADDHSIVVTNVRTGTDGIDFEGTSAGVDGKMRGKVTLTGGTVRCSLDAPAGAAFAADDAHLVGWPAGFLAERGDRYLLPHGSGFSFPAEETNLGSRFDARMHGYSREWRMGLWAQYTEHPAEDGEILGAGGYMAVVETPCNTVGFHLKRANGLMGFSCLWESDLGTWGHARSIRFEFLEDCSPMTVALRYREEMKRKGYYKTFAEKAKERPKMAESFRRLAGAPSVWYWAIDGDKAGVCRYLRETCGFGDFMFQFAKRRDLGVWVTPEEVKACAEAVPGVLLSEYDIYKDTMEKKYLPLIEYVRPYWSLDAADNDDIVYDAAGQAVRGWKVALKGDFDGFGKGLGCATVCERTIAKYVRRRMTEELAKYPWYTGRYLDATGCFEPFECYNPRHRMSRRDCVRDRREMMAIPGDEYGLLSSTEDGQDFLASVCDYFACGFSGANDYRVDGGRWMWKIYDGEPPDEIRRGTDEKTRMPIFEMVYHGCCVSYWDWCDYNFKFPKIWWKRDLFNALCGTPPLYFFNEETWPRFRDRLKASYDVTTPIARATYSTPMRRYRILTPDRSVHRVEFENGVASTVNFGEKPFTMKDGFVLAPRGHRFEFAGAGAAPERDFRLRDGDHLVFCGDSITCHSWTRENGCHHLVTNALERSGRAKGVTVTGLGFCGNTVRDWIGREGATRGPAGKTQMSNRHGDRFPPQDVKKALDGKVDVVVLLLGMNDILMPAVGPTAKDRADWARDYARLASNLWARTSARTLVLGTFTPLTADPDGPKNTARREMNRHIRRIAAEMGACVWDAGAAAEATIDETRRCDPAFREAPDFVHPGDLGHLAMAASFCRAVGEDAAAADLDARREAQMRVRFPLKPSVSYRLHPRSLAAPKSERLAYDLSWNVRGLKDPELTFEVPDGWDCTPKTARGVAGEVRLVGRPDRWRNAVRIAAAADGAKAFAEVPVATPWCVSDGFDFAAAWKGMDWRTNAIPPVSAETARWTRLVAGTWDYLGRCESGSVDLYQAWFGGRTDSVYVRRRIVSRKCREVGFVIGTESFSSTLGFVVTLNGRDVWRGTLPRGMKRLAPEAKLHLRAGDNELVIRVDHNQWQRQFAFDLVPDGDDALEDLRFDWRPSPGEAEDVGGGALEKDRVIGEAAGQPCAVEPFATGERTFDRGWEFRLSDSAIDFKKVGLHVNDNGITSLFRETNGWTAVDIPHDWMIAMPVAQNGRNGFRAVGRNHPGNSIGWYRKRFTVPEDRAERPRVYLQFDGIYRDAQFWVNGIYLGRNDSGYIGCRFDVSDLVEYGGVTNSVAVRVDASVSEGWWYEGAGMYRHVKLIVKGTDHIEPDGILFRTLEISDGKAVVSAEAAVVGTGKVVFELDGQPFEKTLTVRDPGLWSPDEPNLHTLVARLLAADGTVKDEVSLQVGIRRFRFDAKEGLFVNGVPTKVKGVCCHGDMGCVGVAIPDALHDYRAKLLKGMGANADRTCHNPPAPEFLDACDRAGILVMDETRLFASTQEGESQFRRLVLRDRNHACVAAFSIGNEEHNVQAHAVGARMATRLRDLSHALAPDVAVTYGGNNGSVDAGVNPVVDVRGVNYVRIGSSDKLNKRVFDAPDRYHAAHPDQPVWGSEEASSLSTRGASERSPDGGIQQLRDGDLFGENVCFPWAATAEQWWNYAVARPWFAGAMAWTGFDYRGECRWPATVNNFGIMDLCGFPKASYWYYKANWTDEDVLNAWPQWQPGVTNLWVDSNCDTVEVLVNGKSVGRRKGDRLHHLSFPVTYEPGTVEVRGLRKGRAVTFRAKTPAPAVGLRLSADRTTLAADGSDATVINVQAVDAEGCEARTSCDALAFEVSGAGRIIGVGNGNPLSHEDEICPDGNWKRLLFNGKAQCVVKAAEKPGELNVRVRLVPTGAVSEVVLDVH